MKKLPKLKLKDFKTHEQACGTCEVEDGYTREYIINEDSLKVLIKIFNEKVEQIESYQAKTYKKGAKLK